MSVRGIARIYSLTSVVYRSRVSPGFRPGSGLKLCVTAKQRTLRLRPCRRQTKILPALRPTTAGKRSLHTASVQLADAFGITETIRRQESVLCQCHSSWQHGTAHEKSFWKAPMGSSGGGDGGRIRGRKRYRFLGITEPKLRGIRN